MIHDLAEYTRLRSFATPVQEATLEALEAAEGDDHAAAADLGTTPEAVRARLKRLQRQAAKRGYQAKGPEDLALDGFAVKGTSTLLREDGSVAVRWVKTERDKSDRLEALFEAIQGAFKPLPRSRRPKRAPGLSYLSAPMSDLLSVIPIGDPHLGQYSWALESGSDSDLKIQEHYFCAAMAQLVDQAPPTDECLIVNLGDFFHSDNLQSRTTRSGHALDTDSRWPKVIHVGLRVMRTAIECALAKHQRVTVINAIGNHDDHTSIFLSIALDQIYADEPRVRIGRPAGSDPKDPPPPVAFHYFPFGKVLLGVTHGHTAKGSSLPGIMAAAVPELWGSTVHRTWLCGHIHHRDLKEYAGCTVEHFRTLAARDAYAASHGYHSHRDMVSILYHREHGEIARHTLALSRLPAVPD